MMVFCMVQTSSDTEVVGDLLRTVFGGQLGDPWIYALLR
jgi:hypothetical protein